MGEALRVYCIWVAIIGSLGWLLGFLVRWSEERNDDREDTPNAD